MRNIGKLLLLFAVLVFILSFFAGCEYTDNSGEDQDVTDNLDPYDPILTVKIQ